MSDITGLFNDVVATEQVTASTETRKINIIAEKFI
jgi:hypothetical protein